MCNKCFRPYSVMSLSFQLPYFMHKTTSLASWVECEIIYLWLWSFCTGGRRFAPRPWHYSSGSFSSSLARFSPPNIPSILNLFKISLHGENFGIDGQFLNMELINLEFKFATKYLAVNFLFRNISSLTILLGI